jgi:ankyrin repeat protein
MFRRVNIVEELLNRKASVNDGREEELLTPLHMAAAVGNVAIMNKLLEREADPNAQCGFYGGVVNAAIQSGNVDAVKILVGKGVSLANPEDDCDDADSKDGEDIDEDVDENDDEKDEENENENEDENEEYEDDDDGEDEITRAPLASAALRSDTFMFDFLVENYSDRLPPKEFDTAFIKAAGAGRMEVFKKLLSDYKHTKKVFQEALEEATYGEQWDVVMLLLEAQPGLNCDDPMTYASWADEGKEELMVMEAMWEYSGGSVSAKALDESLYAATDYENLEAVKLLLRFGASPDAVGKE